MKRSLPLLILILGFFLIGVGFWVLRQPKIVVVPHHNVVASMRRQLLSYLSQQRLVTNRIVILSTDHFGKNQHRIVTSSPNESLFPLAVADNESIYADHGIMNIVADIREIFPQARYYPLILGNEVRISELAQIQTSIQSFCGFDCLLIASVDFSHYLPAAIAMTHDTYSIHTLENRNAEMIWKAETDSPQVLWLAIRLALQGNINHWTTYAQTNSSVIINDPWYESTSHVFGWYQGGLPRQNSEIHTFTTINATSSAGLTLLGERLTYGSDDAAVSCDIPLASEMVITGWETKDALYVGLLPIQLTPKGYMWKRQLTSLPSVTCHTPVTLLPGTTN